MQVCRPFFGNKLTFIENIKNIPEENLLLNVFIQGEAWFLVD